VGLLATAAGRSSHRGILNTDGFIPHEAGFMRRGEPPFTGGLLVPNNPQQREQWETKHKALPPALHTRRDESSRARSVVAVESNRVMSPASRV